MIEGSGNFMGGKSSLHVATLPSLVVKCIAVVGTMVSVCHRPLIKGPCNFMGGSHSWQVTTLPSLVAIGIVVTEICF